MLFVSVSNDSKGRVLGSRVRVASSLLDRAVGLLATATLSEGEGLWIKPCRSIHTFFMRYPIDTLFLDGQGRVLVAKTYAPWRMSGWETKADGVLEFPAGTITRTQTQVGDQISFRSN